MHQEKPTQLPAVKSFAATGRGRMLMKFINSPLKAKELEKRKNLQACMMSRKFNLPISCKQNISESKTHIQTTLTISNTCIKDKEFGEDHCKGPSYLHTAKKKYTDSSNNENQGQFHETTELHNNGDQSNNMKQSGNQATAISSDKVVSVLCNNANKLNDGNEAVWADWEKSVVVEGNSFDDEDLDELAVVGENDDITDVLVQQYVTSLQDESKNAGATDFDRKTTAARVQKVSKLKSTANAKTPGVTPNPPRRTNCWGTLESTSLMEVSGWGEVSSASLNCYNDGVSLWDSSSTCSKDSTNYPSSTCKPLKRQSACWFQLKKGTHSKTTEENNIDNQVMHRSRVNDKYTKVTNPSIGWGGSSGSKVNDTNGWGGSSGSKLNDSIGWGGSSGSKVNDSIGWGGSSGSKLNDTNGWGWSIGFKTNDSNGWGGSSGFKVNDSNECGASIGSKVHDSNKWRSSGRRKFKNSNW